MTTHSSQEETLAGGVPNVHGLHGHRIHRTSKAAKKENRRASRCCISAVGPAYSAGFRAAMPPRDARSSLLHPTALWHWKVSCIACAHQGYRLDYLQGQGRLTRPPRDGSLRIHPSPGPSGGTDRTKSIVLAGCLLPDGSPSETETH